MKSSISQSLLLVTLICILSSCISINDSIVTNSTYLTKNNFKYIGTAYGESEANYFFFIGGNLKSGQAKEAYENMKANANLKDGQAFVNIILDYKKTYFLSKYLNGWGQVKAIISADIVQFIDEAQPVVKAHSPIKQDLTNKKILDEDFENYVKMDLKNETFLDEMSVEHFNSINEFHVISETDIDRVINKKNKEFSSYSFNGNSSYIKISNFCLKNIKFINFWIKPNIQKSENKQQIFLFGPSKNNDYISAYIYNQTLYVERYLGETKSETNISLKGKLNSYSMISINISENGELKVFLNAQQLNKSSTLVESSNNKNNCEKVTLTLGSNKFFSEDFYNGIIEDFKISKENKDNNYINSIYNN
jgi:hypothetical protein